MKAHNMSVEHFNKFSEARKRVYKTGRNQAGLYQHRDVKSYNTSIRRRDEAEGCIYDGAKHSAGTGGWGLFR